MTTTALPYLSGNFAPVRDEVTAYDLEVIGRIPDDLVGRYLRNGPNPVKGPDPAAHHWFIGDGMVHGVRLNGGRAEWYRNRYVRSGSVAAALGVADTTGPVNGNFNGGPNTNVGGFAGTTWAMVEAGSFPVELSYELETKCRNNFFGTLPGAFSAHPKYDPATGELHAMAYSWPTWLDHIQYVVVGRDGRVTKTVDVHTHGMTMVHDMSLTSTYAVVYDLPVSVDFDLAFGGTGFPFRWNPDYPARVGLLRRDAVDDRDIVWCDVAPCYVFHPLNAFDTPDGKVVVDVCRYDTVFATDTAGPGDAPATLDRWTIDPQAGKVSEQRIDDRGFEFPRHDPRVGNREHRYGYSIGVTQTPGEPFMLGGVYKHDFHTGSSAHHDFGPGRVSGEAVFVPREGSTAEDDGWLVSLVHDLPTDRAELAILHAQDVAGAEVARVLLPQRVPFGFHGNWVPDRSVAPD